MKKLMGQHLITFNSSTAVKYYIPFRGCVEREIEDPDKKMRFSRINHRISNIDQ